MRDRPKQVAGRSVGVSEHLFVCTACMLDHFSALVGFDVHHDGLARVCLVCDDRFTGPVSVDLERFTDDTTTEGEDT